MAFLYAAKVSARIVSRKDVLPGADAGLAMRLPPNVEGTGAQRRLLTTAVELFAARGYHGVSVRDIVGAMGLKPSSLYAHYGSKEELYSTLVVIANTEILRVMSKAHEDTATAPANEQLTALIRTYVEFHTDYPLLSMIGHNDLHVLSGADLETVTALRRDASNLLRSVIERGNGSGLFACPHPWIAVAAMAAMGIRLASWYRPPGHPADPQAPTDKFLVQVQDGWAMPQYDMETINVAFADFALSMVHYAPSDAQ